MNSFYNYFHYCNNDNNSNNNYDKNNSDDTCLWLCVTNVFVSTSDITIQISHDMTKRVFLKCSVTGNLTC